MKKNIRQVLASVIMATSALSSLAVPAKPGLIEMTRPDGTTINVRIHGDEFHHFLTTEDGYYIVEDKGDFYYADVNPLGVTVNSGIRAAAPAARTAEARAYLAGVDMDQVRATMTRTAEARLSAMAQTQQIAAPAFASSEASGPQRGPGLFPGSHFPATGKQKGLVILVEYTDVKMSVSDPHDYFTRMLNEEGFSSYGGTGSAKDFFLEVSGGKFDPDFDVFGPVTLPQNQAYYGGNNYSGDDQRPAHMVRDACDLLDDQINFKDYDRDGDGIVDNVFVFYAGRGEASGGSANTVWPHAWNVEYGIGYQPTYDGVKVSRYACSNEWEGSRPDGVGTFVHEFSHVMGLPDLYATSYTSSFTPGSWSCMDYGPYNNGGCTPPLYGAFERYALGWLEPKAISEPEMVTLPAIGENVAAIIKTSKTNEFFLLENRQKVSWDKYIPGHGMLVWHIDYNSSVWNQNVVNNTPSHQYVDIEEADGTQTEGSRAGDAFPGTARKTSFTDTTNPSMKTWAGQSLNKPLTDITETDGIITFAVSGGTPVDVVVPAGLETITFDENSFTASWETVPGLSYIISVFTRPGAETQVSDRVYVEGYENLNIGKVSSYRVTGLQPEVTYYYTLRSSAGSKVSDESAEVKVTTGKTPFNTLVVNALDPTNVGDTSFTAVWEPVAGATDYILNVFTKSPRGSMTDVCNFNKGADNLPDGWEANTTASYAMDNYVGKASPSLRFSQSGEYIASATYEADVLEVSFWHRGSNTAAGDEILLRVSVNGHWQTVKSIPVVTDMGGSVTTVTLNVAGANRARIEYRPQGNKGSVAIDDIAVTYGIQPERKAVQGYKDLRTGNVTSYEVRGLDPSTLYYYTVQATDGTTNSISSNEISVETTFDSAINSIEAIDGDAPVEYFNLQGIRVDNPTTGIYIRRQGSKVTKVQVR
ncbi:MAG: M6 family metalloprotease domain-containing protein [Muribaculaceae bacterium]|nr:M6 family metalloprotease domain-containing protein [Muribaculaceae bacterium]